MNTRSAGPGHPTPDGRFLRLTVGLPPSLNVWMRWHQMVRVRHAQAVREEIYWLVRAAGWQGPPMKRAEVVYTFWFPDGRRRDPDNALAGTKFIADGLVDAGVLTDDDFQHYAPTVRWGGVDKRRPRVEIIVREVG